METQTVGSLLAVLLLAVLDFSFAEEIPTYFKDGGELMLRPSVTDSISSIVWKHNGHLIAELVDPKGPIDYYGRYKDRVTLDKTSGVLVIKNLTSSDVGTYTVEINNRIYPQRYIGKVIKVVPKPDVWPQPISCHHEEDSCKLKCGNGDAVIEEAEPIIYEWKEDNGAWRERGKIIPISKADHANIKTFTCKMKNPVSEEESKPMENIFYQEPSSSGSASPGMIVGIVFAVLLILLVILGVLFREKIKAFLDEIKNKESSKTVNGHNSMPPENPETVPLDKPADKEATEGV